MRQFWVKLTQTALLILAVISIAVVDTSYHARLSAQNTSTSSNNNLTNAIRASFAYEAVTVAGSAIGFTAATINPTVTDKPAEFTRATLANCINSGAQIRINTFGTPTSSAGLPIESGSSFQVYGYSNISAFLAIRTTGTSSTLYCEYSRVP